MSHPEDRISQPGARRAKHAEKPHARRVSVIDRISAILHSISPGELENRPRVWLAAILAGVVAMVLLCVRILAPGVVGMADDGDGFRLLCAIGLGNDRPFTADPLLAIWPSWEATAWHGLACPAPDAPIFSSYYVLAVLAQVLSLPFGGGLDLRILGLLLALVVAGLIVALVRYLPGSTPFRLVIAGVVLLLLMDSSFIDFFVSADIVGTELVAVLAAFVSLLILWGGYAERVTTLDVPPRGVLALGFAIALAALVITTSPLVGLAFLPGFVGGLIWVPILRDRERAKVVSTGRALRGDRGREVKRKFVRMAPALAASVLLLAIAAAQVSFDATRDKQAEVYDGIFLTILPSSPSPAADLEWFGLDAALAGASGQAGTSTAAAEVFADPAFAGIGASDVVLFNLAHLERIVSVADRGMAALASPLQAHRGNFLDVRLDAEGALVHDEHWVPVQWGSKLLYSVPLLIPASQIAGMLLALALAFAHTGSVRSRSLGWATFFLLLGSAVIFWVTLFSPHTSLSEALLPSTLVLWLTGPLLIACAALRLTTGSGSKSEILSPTPKNPWIAATTRSAARPSP